MKLVITLIIIILILFIICIYMNRLNNINSVNAMIQESFAPQISANVAKGPSALYGWKTHTYNPSWGEKPRTINRVCCSCDDTDDADDADDTE